MNGEICEGPDGRWNSSANDYVLGGQWLGVTFGYPEDVRPINTPSTPPFRSSVFQLYAFV